MRKTNSRRANALVVVLGILFLISTVVVTFAKLSTGEMAASGNFAAKLQARLVSQAGLQQAISKLRSDFREHLFCNLKSFLPQQGESPPPADWCYRLKDSDLSSGEDHIADGIEIEDLQIFDADGNGVVDDEIHPSYALDDLFHQRKISGILAANQAFTLKIFDTNSQLDLNSHIVPAETPIASIHLVKMIENLSFAIAAREPYISKFGDSKGPFFSDEGDSLAAAIIAKREEQGQFFSKSELSQVEGMNADKLALALDYVTVYSPKRIVISRDDNFSDEIEPYRGDSRSPINVNTASIPVLLAVFQGLTYQDPDDPDRIVTIQTDEAEKLAEKICQDRMTTPFFSWEGFKGYLLANKDSIFSGSSSQREEKALIVTANCDPNVSLRRLNPDASNYQRINKTDLLYNTTELCFYPQGVFEITSLGQIFTDKGQVVTESKLYTVARVFNLMHKSTQIDFQTAQLVASPENLFLDYDERYSLNATSHTNQIMMQPPHQESIYFGYVQPVISNYKYGETALDDPVDEGGDLMFKCNFNKSLHADAAFGRNTLLTTVVDGNLTANAILPQAELKTPLTPMQGKNPNLVTAPNFNETTTAMAYGDLVPDGIVFWEDIFDDGNLSAKDQIRAAKAKTTLCYQADGNLPNPELDSADGTLAFWFKLNDNQQVKLRTIFFATSMMTPGAFGNKRGIQMEVKMSYNQGDGTMEIHAQRKYYTATPPDDPTQDSPFAVISSKVIARYEADGDDANAIKAHEWYHLAIRWRNGTEFDNEAIILSGNFYDEDDSGGLEDTPTNTKPLKLQLSPVEVKMDGSTTAADYAPLEPREIGANQQAGEIGTGQEKANPGSEPSDLDSGVGRMYFGAMYREITDEIESMAMTIDDIRIWKGADAIDDSAVIPSRYPQMEGSEGEFSEGGTTFGVIAKFNGTFINKPEIPVVLGVMDWTLRNPSGTIDGTPLILPKTEALGQLTPPVNPLLPKKPQQAFFAEDDPFNKTSTPISLWDPEEVKKPIFINNKDLDKDARQLGVKNDIWEKLRKEVFDSDAEKAMSVQEFIDTFGVLVLVIWEANRGPLPPLQDFIDKDFNVLDDKGKKDDEVKVAKSIIEDFAQTLKNVGQKIRNEGKALKKQGDDNDDDALEKQGEALEEAGKDLIEVGKDLEDDADEGEIESDEIEDFFYALMRAVFSFKSPKNITDEQVIARVDANLAGLPALGIQNLGFNNLGQLNGGVVIVPLPLLGFNLKGRDKNLDDVVDDNGSSRVKKVGQSISGATLEEISVLPEITNFDFQLRFQVEKDSFTNTMPEQFVAPIVDDITVSYQNKVVIIEQFDFN